MDEGSRSQPDHNNGSGHAKRPHDDNVDAGSAKRSRGGGFDRIEMRILIPSNTAGAIIGKGGTNIKELRQEFNANVQIPDSQGDERVITAITKKIDDAAKLSGRIVDALVERMNQKDKDGIIKLLVHKSQAGTIIGLKGSRIKEMRETTGANIKVNQNCCPDSTDRICQIKGPTATIVKCAKMILDLLQGAPPKGPVHNYDPNYWDDSYDYGGYNKFERDGPMMDRGRRGGFNRGGGGGGRGSGARGGFRRGGGRYDQDSYSGGGYGGRGMSGHDRGGYSGERNRYGGGRGVYGGYDEDGYEDYEEDYYDQGFDQQGFGEEQALPEMGGGFDEGNEGDTGVGGEEITTQVTIPTDLAGSIIGKGGTRIRQIRQDSGAMIKINEPETGSEERIITIIGSQEQTQNAQYLLQKSVKMYSGERF